MQAAQKLQPDIIRIGGFGTLPRVDSRQTHGSSAIVEHTLAPGLLGAPPHRHAREDEISYVLEGELSVEIGTEVTVVRAGDLIVKPRGIHHTFWNTGRSTVRFLEVISPGGFEPYFAELAALIRPDVPPDMSALAALGARYGVDYQFERIPELCERYGLRLG